MCLNIKMSRQLKCFKGKCQVKCSDRRTKMTRLYCFKYFKKVALFINE